MAAWSHWREETAPRLLPFTVLSRAPALGPLPEPCACLGQLLGHSGQWDAHGPGTPMELCQQFAHT